MTVETMTELVLTAISRDRPGIVEALARVVAGHSGNWIDSSMARLGGEFAGIVRITVPQSRAAALADDLAELGDAGISVLVHQGSVLEAREQGEQAMLELVGTDHPGIVHEVTRVLTAQGVSVDELHTEVLPGSMSGEPVFRAEAEIVLPKGLSRATLAKALEGIALDLMVEIALRDDEGA